MSKWDALLKLEYEHPKMWKFSIVDKYNISFLSTKIDKKTNDTDYTRWSGLKDCMILRQSFWNRQGIITFVTPPAVTLTEI